VRKGQGRILGREHIESIDLKIEGCLDLGGELINEFIHRLGTISFSKIYSLHTDHKVKILRLDDIRPGVSLSANTYIASSLETVPTPPFFQSGYLV